MIKTNVSLHEHGLSVSRACHVGLPVQLKMPSLAQFAAACIQSIVQLKQDTIEKITVRILFKDPISVSMVVGVVLGVSPHSSSKLCPTRNQDVSSALQAFASWSICYRNDKRHKPETFILQFAQAFKNNYIYQNRALKLSIHQKKCFLNEEVHKHSGVC